jgi:hypothetical protein
LGAILRFRAFLAFRNFNKLRVINILEYSDSPRLQNFASEFCPERGCFLTGLDVLLMVMFRRLFGCSLALLASLVLVVSLLDLIDPVGAKLAGDGDPLVRRTLGTFP